MAFSTTFSKPKSRKQAVVSEKWTRLGPPKERSHGLKKVAKKGEFWLFVSKVLNDFFLRINLPQTCEYQGAFCDNYHKQPAHSRRRQDIRVGDWWYAFRVAVLCNECHFEIDAKGRREAEPIIEGLITNRFKRMGLSPYNVRTLLLRSATAVQVANPKQYGQYTVTLDIP